MPPSMPPAEAATPAARRMNHTNSPISRIVGTNPTSSVSHTGCAEVAGFALTTVPLLSSSASR